MGVLVMNHEVAMEDDIAGKGGDAKACPGNIQVGKVATSSNKG
jgi:hypothetical protein